MYAPGTRALVWHACLVFGLGITCPAAAEPPVPTEAAGILPPLSVPRATARTLGLGVARRTASHDAPGPSTAGYTLAPLPPATAPVVPLPAEASAVARDELSLDVLVQQVLARNPSLAEMVAAWQAASARYPQVTSLEDPVVGATLGPGSFGSTKVDFAYRLEVSQKYPFPGKLGLRGQNALAEASAAGHEVEDTRLQLIATAQDAFYAYYLVGRALAVNEEALRLLREFRANAATRFQTGLVSEQDVLQADVEIGRQRERQVTLEEAWQVAVARLNTLLHLPPDSPLPPPPGQLDPAGPLPEVSQLRAAALARRPDLRALADRIRAEEAALGLAHKEFAPDFEVLAAYDAFWQERELRPMVGVHLNLPVRKARRYGAVAEAEARIAQRVAELARLTDQVNFQVQEAYEQVRKGERVVRLYQDTILTAAQGNVQAAQAAYVTGKVPFLSLIEAERNVVNLQDRYYEALAEYFRRRAALERATGGPLVAWSPTDSQGPIPPWSGPEPAPMRRSAAERLLLGAEGPPDGR